MNGLLRFTLFAACAGALAVAGVGCSKQSTPGLAFATPEAAVDSVVAALRANDRPQLDKVFGSGADELLASGDAVADANGVQTFLANYDRQHRLTTVQDGVVTLEVGPQAWPMPIPIVKDADGWRFDTAAGLDEMLNRRIGRNELATIETCRALADAEQDYFTLNPMGLSPPAYAARLFSSDGKRDGLYWPVAEGEPPSPIGPLLAEAAAEGYRRSTTGAPVPYHGYYIRLLKAQGRYAPGGAMSYVSDGRLTRGFGVVAYPTDYGNSGIMTFIVNQQGIVYQRDLGQDTAATAKAMTEFNPDENWKVVVEELTVEVVN